MRALPSLLAVALLAACARSFEIPADAEPDAVLCTTTRTCDDGVYCTGNERCAPGDPGADARGCITIPRCSAVEVCDEATRSCRNSCELLPDEDGDGAISIACGGNDCDDTNAAFGPAMRETCDGSAHDEDCNPETFGDEDRDGDGEVSHLCCNRPEPTIGICGRDCDDTRPDVHPRAPEICNGRDDDCDEEIDEGFVAPYYVDRDGDGFGDGPVELICAPGPMHVTEDGDCAPWFAAAHPGAAEICDGGFDEDCDGSVDEGCPCDAGSTTRCGSPHGVCREGTQRCEAGAWTACDGTTPRGETCDDTDEDCDGVADEGCPCVRPGPADPARACGGELGSCFWTEQSCRAGYLDGCRAGARPGIQRCVGGDEDCDGRVDEGC